MYLCIDRELEEGNTIRLDGKNFEVLSCSKQSNGYNLEIKFLGED